MPKTRVRACATTAAALLSLSVVLVSGQRGGTAAPGQNFPLPGGNLRNQHYSTLKQIAPANIGRLGGAWTAHLLDNTPSNMSRVEKSRGRRRESWH
jgi:glucose dehydrogenase